MFREMPEVDDTAVLIDTAASIFGPLVLFVLAVRDFKRRAPEAPFAPPL